MKDSSTFVVTRKEQPLGEVGVRFSLEEVARRATKGRLDPHVRAWTMQKLKEAKDAGKPTEKALDRARVLLAAVRKEFVYAPDPTHSEMMTGPHLLVKGVIPGGDCFPVSVHVLRKDVGTVPIGHIEPGHQIWGLDRWTRVKAVLRKGTLPVTSIALSNGTTLQLTANHKMNVVAGPEDALEVRAVSELRPGDLLASPSRLPVTGTVSGDIVSLAVPDARVRVLSVTPQAALYPCVDIETEDHHVFLVEYGVTVRNCDDLSILTIACFLASTSSVGMRCAVVGHAYDAEKNIQHVLAAVHDRGRWWYADPSTDAEFGEWSLRPSRERVIDVPCEDDAPAFCDADMCLTGLAAADPPMIARVGDFVGIEGVPLRSHHTSGACSSCGLGFVDFGEGPVLLHAPICPQYRSPAGVGAAETVDVYVPEETADTLEQYIPDTIETPAPSALPEETADTVNEYVPGDMFKQNIPTYTASSPPAYKPPLNTAVYVPGSPPPESPAQATGVPSYSESPSPDALVDVPGPSSPNGPPQESAPPTESSCSSCAPTYFDYADGPAMIHQPHCPNYAAEIYRELMAKENPFDSLDTRWFEGPEPQREAILEAFGPGALGAPPTTLPPGGGGTVELSEETRAAMGSYLASLRDLLSTSLDGASQAWRNLRDFYVKRGVNPPYCDKGCPISTTESNGIGYAMKAGLVALGVLDDLLAGNRRLVKSTTGEIGVERTSYDTEWISVPPEAKLDASRFAVNVLPIPGATPKPVSYVGIGATTGEKIVGTVVIVAGSFLLTSVAPVIITVGLLWNLVDILDTIQQWSADRRSETLMSDVVKCIDLGNPPEICKQILEEVYAGEKGIIRARTEEKRAENEGAQTTLSLAQTVAGVAVAGVVTYAAYEIYQTMKTRRA